MPKYEQCVRLTSWPRFGETSSSVPFEQRPIDVPAKQLRQSAGRQLPKERHNDVDWYLCVPKSHSFAEGGPGVVPRSTAAKVGYNSSGFVSKVPLLKQGGKIRDISWPPDFSGPPHTNKGNLKVAPENWVARKTLQSSESPRPRYPPLNYYNALEGRPPSEMKEKLKFVATYNEPPFPILEGTCAYSAALRLEDRFNGRLQSSVSVLDLYREIRSKMNICREDDLDGFLQPRAQEAGPEAKEEYLAVLKEKRVRLKRSPHTKRTAIQIFRTDRIVAEKMRSVLLQQRQVGDARATIASVSKAFWESATAVLKKKYEELPALEEERVEKEFAEYREG